MKINFRNIILSLGAILLLTSCTSSPENKKNNHGTENTSNHSSVININNHNIADNATDDEIVKEKKYQEHIKKVKKSKMHKLKEPKVDLEKFCFENSKSIHYKANERCE